MLPDLRDRAAAVGAEIHELRRQAALAADVRTLMPLKEADRALKREFGRGDPGDAYGELKERLAEQLYQEDIAEERVVQRRIENLKANVRRDVEAEHAAEAEAKQAEQDAHYEAREAAVAERERQASPSYRASFAAAGALLALSADLLIRLVA